jgi:hypothetical protein
MFICGFSHLKGLMSSPALNEKYHILAFNVACEAFDEELTKSKDEVKLKLITLYRYAFESKDVIRVDLSDEMKSVITPTDTSDFHEKNNKVYNLTVTELGERNKNIKPAEFQNSLKFFKDVKPVEMMGFGTRLHSGPVRLGSSEESRCLQNIMLE